MSTIKQTLEFIRHGAIVKRFHTWPTLTEDNVARHSFGVAWLCWLLMDVPSGALTMAALAHDLAESKVGDIPSHVKTRMALSSFYDEIEDEQLRMHALKFELSKAEQGILEVADQLECLLYCAEERRLGNQNMDLVYDRARKKLLSISEHQLPKARHLLLIIDELYLEAKSGYGCIEGK